MLKKTFILLSMLFVFASGSALAVPLPDAPGNAVLYGDFYSYSLPLLAYRYDLLYGGGVGPGNPFYVPTGPGQIKDDIVVATGASGKPVNYNLTNIDNAYATPNSTGQATWTTGGEYDPSTLAKSTSDADDLTFDGDQASTWDASLAALTSFLDGGDLLFFFNNNQINSDDSTDQNLRAWAQLSLRDIDGNLDTLYFDFTNTPVMGGYDPTVGPGDYTSLGLGTPDSALPDSKPHAPIMGTSVLDNNTDYVFSGGDLFVDPANGRVVVDIGGVWRYTDDFSEFGGTPDVLAHNLGANQSPYVIIAPEVNDILAVWGSGSDYDGYDTMSLDIRFDYLNNGFEQIFIRAGDEDTFVVPEPTTLFLLGLGLLGLVGCRRRKK